MYSLSFSEFVDRITDRKRITFGDVRRLRRNVLADGVTTREQAEMLILLDRFVRNADPAWAEYLLTEIVNFVVWGTRPTGYVDRDTVEWVLACLHSENPTKTAARIAREIVREAQGAEPELVKAAPHGSTAASAALA